MSNFLLQEWGWGVVGGGGRKMVMKNTQKEKE